MLSDGSSDVAQSIWESALNVRFGLLQALVVLYGYRARLREGVFQDIRQRYAGSVLGLGWAVLYPLLLLGIYSVIYVYVFRIRPPSLDEYQYLVLVFSGLVPLLAFNESLVSATGSLAGNRNLLLNTVFPAELIPVRAALGAQVPSIASLVATLVAGFSMGLTTSKALLVVPVLWLLLLMFVIGLGWVLSLLMLVARDIQQALALVLMILMVLSPFAYTPDMVPPGLKLLLYFNPLSYFVLSFQQVICYGAWPAASSVLPAAALAFASFFGGFWLFRRVKFVFFDYA